MRPLALLLATSLAGAGASAADVALPATDAPGAQDHPLLPRDEGALIVDQTVLEPGRATVPAGPPAPPSGGDRGGDRDIAGDQTVRQSPALAAAPPTTMDLTGRITRTVYLSPAGRDPLDITRGYREVVRALGGEILHECTSRACGGDVSTGAGPARSGDDGRADGRRAGVIASLFPPGQRLPAAGSPGGCAVRDRHRNQRYTLARLPGSVGSGDLHAVVLTYTLAPAGEAVEGCGAFADRAVAVVLVAEPPPDGPAAASTGDLSAALPRDGTAAQPPAGTAATTAPPSPPEARLRAFIHHAAADPDGAALARALAERLEGEGFTVVDVRDVPFAIAAAGVRYFFDEDRDGARRLLQAAVPLLADTGRAAPSTPADFTHYEPKPRPGTVEIWLPGG